MTNKEYIEKNKISFSEAMKMWNNKKYPCINDWLNQEHYEHKFKIGDILMTDCVPNKKDHIFFVVDYDDISFYVREFDRKGNVIPRDSDIDISCKYTLDNSIKRIDKIIECLFKKIV